MPSPRNLPRIRLRTLLALPVVVAVVLWGSDYLLFATPRARAAWRASLNHARLMGPPSPAVVAQRDRIMAVAGAAIRADLLALAERYPRLKEPDGGPIRKVLEGIDPPGRLSINLSRRLSPADQPPLLIPSLEYDAEVRLFIEPIDQATFIKHTEDQYYDGLVYPHLNLWGKREPAANDPFLATELKRIIDKHLAPLDALEAKLNRTSIPSQGPASSPRR